MANSYGLQGYRAIRAVGNGQIAMGYDPWAMKGYGLWVIGDW